MCLKINCDRCDNGFVVIFFKTMYIKTIIRFGFCDIRNNQGRGKCYQPKPKAEADNTNRAFAEYATPHVMYLTSLRLISLEITTQQARPNATVT